MSNIPEPWGSALVAAGLTDPRNAERPSWNALSRKIGVHTSTLSAMANGTRETEQATIHRVAQALRVDVRTVNGWVGQARSVRDPYMPPGDAHLLDSDEREAINRLIMLLARSKKRGQQDGRQPEAEKSATDGRGDVIDFPSQRPRQRRAARSPDSAPDEFDT